MEDNGDAVVSEEEQDGRREDDQLEERSLPVSAWEWIKRNTNFFRLHLLYFTIMPLIAAAIMWGSNEPSKHEPTAFIDCLFMCYSSMTMTGLNSVLFQTLTTWQQVILYLLILLGSAASVSIVTVFVRQHFFSTYLERATANDPTLQQRAEWVGKQQEKQRMALYERFSRKSSASSKMRKGQEDSSFKEKLKSANRRLSKSDIRIGTARPMEGFSDDLRLATGQGTELETMAADQPDSNDLSHTNSEKSAASARSLEAETVRQRNHQPMRRAVTIEAGHKRNISVDSHERMPRTRTVGFARTPSEVASVRDRAVSGSSRSLYRAPSINSSAHNMPRTYSIAQHFEQSTHSGLGGFPDPISVVWIYLNAKWDALLHRKLRQHPIADHSLGRVPTISTVDGRTKPVSYITFNANVGRNSRFESLTREQEYELGGVEFRALVTLSKILLVYTLGLPLIVAAMTAPYLARSEFRPLFDGTGGTQSSWYTIFNCFSAFANNGMSVLDTSMTTFQSTYFWVITQGFLILAGNTAYPILVRLSIWIVKCLSPAQSRLRESCSFLLDHPRRCSYLLFPRYQTFFLVFVLLILNCTDWFTFLIFDIGNDLITVIPLHIRVFDGLFQSVATRTAGFQILNLANTAPAQQVVYVIMMYVAILPLSMSIRSTNVYEEQAIGIVNHQESRMIDEEKQQDHIASSYAYLAHHVRKQLAFDTWYLMLAVILIAVIERAAIINQTDNAYITLFSILFEVVSAYGTVGLSLGAPKGTSLSGGLRTLSKLILILVMIRGRHRGLPNAIDRSVMLPGHQMHKTASLSEQRQEHPVTADESTRVNV